MRSVDPAQCRASDVTGMADVILHEIAELLAALAASASEGTIDLRGIPMTDADRADLEHRLGHGEVHAVLDVAGTSEVFETSFTGVWWVRHRSADGRISSEEIAVTLLPPILKSSLADARRAAVRLAASLMMPVQAASPHGERPAAGTTPEEAIHA